MRRAGFATVIIIGLALAACGRITVTAREQSRGSDSPVGKGTAVGAEVARTSTVRELVISSELVIIGTPVGSPREVPTDSDVIVDYYQDVAVEKTLKGPEFASVTVVTAGVIPGSAVDVGEELAGPLAAGRQVFFLLAGATAGIWNVTGHSQGAMDFSEDRVRKAPYPELEGLNERQLREFIRAQERGEP